ncbi:hypothetical protein DFP72DRAFT_990036 [Ephemerocybe angulata]|uniref:DUF6570 domain-containing protein n=1 Tax=Ephemerocybe angulata TaxID=980116 RepID=A0A8H6HYN0_9AGAR|nr:hypothetical protein DFP72DRAFT_990036 [Tulosesus angulatus]
MPIIPDSTKVTDPFIIQNCIVSTLSSQFHFENVNLDGLMLHKQGIHRKVIDSDTYDCVDICLECRSSLHLGKIPRFSLSNKLYRGILPDEFHDLTWVEETACALYRGTAHVTRLFNSSNPNMPKQLHGNTCAHEMNVVSTADRLPNTPADILRMLTVVFIGPEDFDPKASGTLFRVRKRKIATFLAWLKCYNRLYQSLHIDAGSINMFPDDGPLPGLAERPSRFPVIRVNHPIL